MKHSCPILFWIKKPLDSTVQGRFPLARQPYHSNVRASARVFALPSLSIFVWIDTQPWEISLIRTLHAGTYHELIANCSTETRTTYIPANGHPLSQLTKKKIRRNVVHSMGQGRFLLTRQLCHRNRAVLCLCFHTKISFADCVNWHTVWEYFLDSYMFVRHSYIVNSSLNHWTETWTNVRAKWPPPFPSQTKKRWGGTLLQSRC